MSLCKVLGGRVRQFPAAGKVVNLQPLISVKNRQFPSVKQQVPHYKQLCALREVRGGRVRQLEAA